MGRGKGSRLEANAVLEFNSKVLVDLFGMARTAVEYGRGETIFTQGDTGDDVLYVQTGGVTLSVLSKAGREAVVATLGPGDFFGEGCLAGQPLRIGSATAITPSVIRNVSKAKMARLLHQRHALSDLFIAHMLSRNIRIEEDLLSQVFNSTDKRLARALLRLAHYGNQEKPASIVPRISEESLAEALGTTTTLVNLYLAKFTKLGFIRHDRQNRIRINGSLLSVVLHD